MRRNSFVLALLGIVCLSTSVVKAGHLRSKQSANNGDVTEKESVHPNERTGGDQIIEKEEKQNLRAGRKLERKKIRVHTVSIEVLIHFFVFCIRHFALTFEYCSFNTSKRPNLRKLENGEDSAEEWTDRGVAAIVNGPDS